MKTSMRKSQGFTLVELMVTLAIVGLIAVIAIPSYRQAIRRSNRADAQIMLARLSTLEERYYFRTNNYTGDFADLVTGATSGAAVASDEGHYSIALTATGGGTGWTMVATAVGSQAADIECFKFTQTSLGAKTAVTSANVASPDCW